MKKSILILALATSAGAFAEEWVSVGGGNVVAAPAGASTNYVDSSQKIQLESTAPSVSTSGKNNNTLLLELATQVEQMQQEIALLRGQLEQQDHLLKRQQEEQQQRYLDVDRRLSVLVAPTSPITNPSKPASSAAGSKETAAVVYQQAMDLTKEKKFTEAQAKFSQLVKEHPDDALVVNAFYWSAEVYLVQGETDKALVAFKKVVNDHSEHAKAADAAYKIGVTLDRQGKAADAKKWLQKVIDDYTGKADTTVRLAQSYLDKI